MSREDDGSIIGLRAARRRAQRRATARDGARIRRSARQNPGRHSEFPPRARVAGESRTREVSRRLRPLRIGGKLFDPSQGGETQLGRILKWPTRADCKSADLRLRGFESLSAHWNDLHEVARSRKSWRNLAAFGGLRASRTKRCEPTRSGAVTLFVPLWAESASLFASLSSGRGCPLCGWIGQASRDRLLRRQRRRAP